MPDCRAALVLGPDHFDDVEAAGVFQEPIVDTPQVAAFAAFDFAPTSLRVPDFGDIAVSRPREDESSTAQTSLDEELVFSAL
jgi:hypothetical protein